MDKEELKHDRTDYLIGSLVEADMPEEPSGLLDTWLEKARSEVGKDYNAMVLSTVADNTPHSRIVLLRGIDERGVQFYTNYNSDKGKELEANPRACANFFWSTLERQIRINGHVEQMTREESVAYFVKRPRESQLGAWSSEQSKGIADRAALEKKFAQVSEKFKEQEVPCPPHWGGYILRLEEVEFWQGRSGRMHDRFRYQRSGETWSIRRLQP